MISPPVQRWWVQTLHPSPSQLTALDAAVTALEQTPQGNLGVRLPVLLVLVAPEVVALDPVAFVGPGWGIISPHCNIDLVRFVTNVEFILRRNSQSEFNERNRVEGDSQFLRQGFQFTKLFSEDGIRESSSTERTRATMMNLN